MKEHRNVSFKTGLPHNLYHRTHEECRQGSRFLHQRLDDNAVNLGVKLLPHSKDDVESLHRRLDWNLRGHTSST